MYPPEPERDGERLDFGDAAVVQGYLGQAQKLVRTRGVMTEYLMLARVEMGLYHTLHRLGARVHTSRIVREHLGRRPPRRRG